MEKSRTPSATDCVLKRFFGSISKKEFGDRNCFHGLWCQNARKTDVVYTRSYFCSKTQSKKSYIKNSTDENLPCLESQKQVQNLSKNVCQSHFLSEMTKIKFLVTSMGEILTCSFKQALNSSSSLSKSRLHEK